MFAVKTTEELDAMRTAGRYVAEILGEIADHVQVGVTTRDLDQIAREGCTSRGVVAGFLGYQGFPGAVCASLNHQVVHGIPSRKTKLRSGDLISIDFGVIYNGFYGDAAMTLPVGEPDAEDDALLKNGLRSLYAGIKELVPGAPLGNYGAAVQQVAEECGYGIVREFVGHGIGRSLHEPPQIPNFGKRGEGPILTEGMVIAVEPMFNRGGDAVRTLRDKWTVVTADGSRSVHVEHMVAIRADGPEILTDGIPFWGKNEIN